MKPSIYLETTIVSYLTARARSGRDPVAAARQQITTAWWQNIRPRFDLYVAFAASHGLGFLLTWNCTHIANGYVRQQIDRVNAERGIATPVICTPEELMEVPDDGW